jgi:hypothetical protein
MSNVLRTLLLACTLLVSGTFAPIFDPGGSGGSGNGATVGTDPGATCTQGSLYFDTDATSGSRLLQCDATDTWIAVLTAEVDTLATIAARGKTVTTLDSFANGINFWDSANDGTTIYTSGTDGAMIVCVNNSVENDCDYYRKLADTKKWGVKDSAGNVELEHTEDTGITAMTVDAETSGVTITIPVKYNIKPVGCSGTTGTLLLDTNATLAPTATCTAGSTNTTLMQAYADFPDSDGEYQFQDKFRLPADWAGAIDLQLYWKAAATSGDVVWQVATLCRADAEIEDAAWNTAQAFAADTAKGTTLQLNTVTLTSLTTTGCSAGEMFYFKIFRQRTHASDSITGVVSLSHGELTVRRAM